MSPRLGYLRDTPVDGGARLFFFEEGGSSISNSLSTSPTRRKLYDEGKYMPKSYMLVWGKPTDCLGAPYLTDSRGVSDGAPLMPRQRRAISEKPLTSA